MALVSKVLSSLFGGVSQQPPTLRLDNQCEEMVNAYPSIARGLEKRPPSEFVSLITTSVSDDVATHLINRDEDEQYLVIFTGNPTYPIEVYTLDGTKCTVQYGTLDEDGGNYTPDASVKTYLDTTTPQASIRATTVADYTIITNKEKTPAMSGSPTTADAPWAVIYSKTAYRKNVVHDVYIDGVKEGTTTTSTADWTTKDVALYLYNALDITIGSLYSMVLDSNLIYLSRINEADFEFYVRDSYGDTALVGIKGTVQKFEDLPPKMLAIAEDKPIKIAKEVKGDGEAYYVKWTRDAAGSDSGYWKETVALGIDNAFDDSTMPHRLVRTGVNTFTLAPCIWAEREVGDEDSAPEPSFIGKAINDVIMHKNRLGFLAGENVILSRSSDFFNFWPATATEVLDDDPIDVAVSSNEVSVLRYAIPFEEQLLLFADQIQFTLTSGEQLLTPGAAACDITTRFEINETTRPVGIGPNLFFPSPKGDYSALREYFVSPDTYLNDAADVSAHTPSYLPSDLAHLIAVPTWDTVFAIEPLGQTMYGYKFYWTGEEKVQSAWFKWTFNDVIYSAAALQNYIYLVVKPYASIFMIVKINMENVNTGNLDFRVHLDNRKLLSGAYAGGYTTWTIPYYLSTGVPLAVVDSSTGIAVPDVERFSTTSVRAAGDYSANQCYVGIDYEMRFTFSEWGLQAPNANIHSLQGRLQVRTLTLDYLDTGYFTVEVTNGARATRTNSMTGVVIGETIFNDPTIRSGRQRVFCIGNSRELQVDLVNDTYLPCQFSTACWEGLQTVRNQVL